MKKLFALALILMCQTYTVSACAHPQITSKQANQKPEGNSSRPKKASEVQKPTHPKSDEQFIERAIKTHVPAPGQFSKRRQRIWETLKRNYAEKKDITVVLRQYVQMNDCVIRGTNWIMDDAGNYTRMRPLSLQCKELEEKLDLPWQSVGK